MASTIIIKNGAGGSTPSSLKQGELAINVDSGSLYYGTSGSSNAVSSSFYITNLTASSNISSSGDIIGNRGLFNKVEIDGEVALDTSDSATTGQLFTDSQITKIVIGKGGEVVSNKIVIEGNVTASGQISASGAIHTDLIFGNGTLNINPNQNGPAFAGNTHALQVYGGIRANGPNSFTGAITATGNISSSAALLGTRLTLTTAGVHKASISPDGEIAAEGFISSSGTGSFRALNITDDGAAKFNVDTNGHVTASGTGSFAGGVESDTTGSFGHLYVNGTINIPVVGASPAGLIQVNGVNYLTGTANDLNVGNLNKITDIRGTNVLITGSVSMSGALSMSGANAEIITEGGVYALGNISSSATLLGTALTLKTNGLDRASIDANGDFTCRTISGSGAFSANTGQFENNGINTLNISDAGAISASSTIQGTALTLQDAGINTLTVDTVGNVSSSGLLSGTSLDIKSAGVAKADIDADGNITTAGIVSSSAGISIFPAISLKVNGVSTLDLIQNGVVSSSATVQGTAFKAQSAGVNKFIVDTSGNVSAEGTISSSGLLSGTALTLATNGVSAFVVSAEGALSASSTLAGTALTVATNGITTATIEANGNISSSGTISTEALIGHGEITELAVDGAISASGTGSFVSLNVADNGIAKFNVDTNGHVSASGDISSSATLLGTDLDLRVAGVAKASIDTDGNIAAEGNISASGVLNANTVQLAHNGVNTLNVSNAGAISASSTIQGTAFTAQTNGATKATIDASGNIAAEGEISSSSTLSGDRLILTTAGVHKASISTDGEIAAEGFISSSGLLAGRSATFASAGVNALTITTAGAISASSTIAGTALTLATNGATKATIDASGNIAAEGEISSSGVLYGTAFETRVNGSLKSTVNTAGNFFCAGTATANGAISSSATLAGTALTLATNGVNALTVDTVGNVSSSATGSFRALTIADDGVTQAAIDAEGGITGSNFQGTKHILTNHAFYVNDNPFIQNSLYFGNTVGNSPYNWNDPQPIGGDPMTVSSFDISDDDQSWGRILPFDVSKIEILCGLRPGLGVGDQFSLVLYTASRVEGTVTLIELTRVAQNGVTFDGGGKYTNNDLTYTGNLDAGTMIYVGVGTNTSSPSAKNAKGYMGITITQR